MRRGQALGVDAVDSFRHNLPQKCDKVSLYDEGRRGAADRMPAMEVSQMGHNGGYRSR